MSHLWQFLLYQLLVSRGSKYFAGRRSLEKLYGSSTYQLITAVQCCPPNQTRRFLVQLLLGVGFFSYASSSQYLFCLYLCVCVAQRGEASVGFCYHARGTKKSSWDFWKSFSHVRWFLQLRLIKKTVTGHDLVTHRVIFFLQIVSLRPSYHHLCLSWSSSRA